jgi:hypothetical protein
VSRFFKDHRCPNCGAAGSLIWCDRATVLVRNKRLRAIFNDALDCAPSGINEWFEREINAFLSGKN